MGFQGGAVGKESAAHAGDARDVSSIPASGRSPGIGNGNPLQYSCLEKLHGQHSLAGYSPWSCREQDMTEQLKIHIHTHSPTHTQNTSLSNYPGMNT